MRKNIQHLKITPLKPESKKQTQVFDINTDQEKTIYTKKAIEHLEHIHFAAGHPPYLRGNNSLMYVKEKLPVKHILNFSNIEAGNKILKQEIQKGKQYFYLDLLAHTASNQKLLNNLEDFKRLFRDIPLNKIHLSICTNNTPLALVAMYLVCAEQLGYKKEDLKLNIEQSLTQEEKKTHLEVLLTTNLDLVNILKTQYPNIKINYLNNLNKEQILAHKQITSIINIGLHAILQALKLGLSIDFFAPLLLCNYHVGKDFLEETAKIRAARMLWAKILNGFKLKNKAALQLRLQGLIDYKDISANSITSMSAHFAGLESIITNLNNLAPHIIQQETSITKTIDPWAGSYYVETLTHQLATNAWLLIKENPVIDLLKQDYTANNIVPNSSKYIDNLKHLIKKTSSKSNLLDLTIIAIKQGENITSINNALYK